MALVGRSLRAGRKSHIRDADFRDGLAPLDLDAPQTSVLIRARRDAGRAEVTGTDPVVVSRDPDGRVRFAWTGPDGAHEEVL